MSQVKGFTFYKSYYESLKNLKEKDKKDIINAMLEYVFDDKIPNFCGVKLTIWTLIEPSLSSSKNHSNNNSGAPKNNQNACKIKENSEDLKTIKKQSKFNQKTINDLYDKDKEIDKEVDKEVDTVDFDTTSPTFFSLTSVSAYGKEKNISKDYCQKFYNYYSEKKQKWKSNEQWQKKLQEWYEKDQQENQGTRLIKIDEGVFKI